MVGDGIAAGTPVRTACEIARAYGAARVVLAVPVAPRSSIIEMAGVADEVVRLEAQERFFAVGQWYEDFSQTSDEEVISLQSRATTRAGGNAVKPVPSRPPIRDNLVEVPAGGVRLVGHLTVPDLIGRLFSAESAARRPGLRLPVTPKQHRSRASRRGRHSDAPRGSPCFGDGPATGAHMLPRDLARRSLLLPRCARGGSARCHRGR